MIVWRSVDQAEGGVGVDGFDGPLQGEEANPVDAREQPGFDMDGGVPGAIARLGDDDVVVAFWEGLAQFGAAKLGFVIDLNGGTTRKRFDLDEAGLF